MSPRHPSARRSAHGVVPVVLGTALALLASVAALVSAPTPARATATDPAPTAPNATDPNATDPNAADPAPADVTTVRAADGTERTIDAQNAARGLNVLLTYTPDWGFTTGTNQWGAEAALEPTANPTVYRVTAVNSVRTDPAHSGNTAIPTDGLVLSAGPDPDGSSGSDSTAVAFLTDHIAVGDQVTITRATTVEQTAQAAAVDPTPASNPDGAPFPGYRGPDQLIVYTPATQSHTGTNQWGVEAIVRDGVVTALPGNDSAIPSDGYVLSGNGKAADWLSANAVVGATVRLDSTTVTVRRDVQTSLHTARSAIDTAKAALEASRAGYVDAPLDSAGARLDTAEQALADATNAAGTDDQRALSLADKAIQAAHQAYYRTMPSRAAETRGMWYRPVEKSRAQIAATLDRMKAAGMNAVYLETYFRGYPIYPSKVSAEHGLPNQNPDFRGFDPLQAWKSEADKRGIAVHAWIDGLAVGNTLGDGIGPVLTTHPEWAARDRAHADDPAPHPSTNGFYWLDVTDPVARRYFLDLMAEMVGTYQLDGIDIDYMRYPDSGEAEGTYNFSPDARKAYEHKEGVDPVTLDPDRDHAAWQAWQGFVDNEENRMVADLARRVRAVEPRAVVSAAPEPGAEADKIGQWSSSIDTVVPQAYMADLAAIHTAVTDQKARMTGGQLMVTGTASLYSHLPSFDAVRFAMAARDIDAGAMIFSWGQASQPIVDALAAGPWRTPAVAPDLHPLDAIAATLRQQVDRIGSIDLPRKGISDATARTLRHRLGDIANQVAADPPTGKLAGIDGQLAGLIGYVHDSEAAGAIAHPIAGNLVAALTYSRETLTYARNRNHR